MIEGQEIDDDVLERLPVFPLPNTVLFPGTELPLHVFEPRYRDLVRYAMNRHRCLGVPLLQPGYEHDYHGRPAIHAVFGAGRIVEAEELPDGRWNIVVVGTDRVRAVRELPPTHTFRLFTTERLADKPASAGVRPDRQTLRGLALRVAEVVPDVTEPLSRLLADVPEHELAEQLACRLIPDAQRRQAILEEDDPARRLTLVTQEVAEVCLRVDPAIRRHTGPAN